MLAFVSGSNRLDEAKLAAVAGVAPDAVGRADADAVRAATSYAVGGVPPFGHPAPLRTWVDLDLLDHDVVWAAAGTPTHVFSVAPGRAGRRHRRSPRRPRCPLTSRRSVPAVTDPAEPPVAEGPESALPPVRPG